MVRAYNPSLPKKDKENMLANRKPLYNPPPSSDKHNIKKKGKKTPWNDWGLMKLPRPCFHV